MLIVEVGAARDDGCGACVLQLTTKITSLPEVGTLYQLSQIFSDFGYKPERGVALPAASTASPVTVTGSKNRLVYNPPPYTNEPDNKVWIVNVRQRALHRRRCACALDATVSRVVCVRERCCVGATAGCGAARAGCRGGVVRGRKPGMPLEALGGNVSRHHTTGACACALVCA
jgi:hypothetical protein